MTAPLTITGSSSGVLPLDLPALTNAGFTWLHLEGTSYLRMPHGEDIDGAHVVVTVVGIADNGTAGWLVVG